MANVIAIIQARMGSTRLPGKVLRQVRGIPLIKTLIDRVSRAKSLQNILLATSTESANDSLEEIVLKIGVPVFRGSEKDVLSRYYFAAEPYVPDFVVRITGDCPLVDPELIDQVVDLCLGSHWDYCRTAEDCFPDGLDTEIFSIRALKEAYQNAMESYDREHVTPFIRKKEGFAKGELRIPESLGQHRWTVDEPEDFEVIHGILNHFYPRNDFSWNEVLQLSKSHPEIFQPNMNILRNEGATLGAGQKLWKRAKRVIPGGNMLLSKRPEMFLPDQWPSYFSKAMGCKVWDLDGKCYTDMSIMGIGTNILGYGHPEVDEAVRKTIDSGNMSTLNCPEEVLLAEKLVELHSWADMVRFARSGGEANAIATRIARAASGRDGIAICGYHGWHDWYLAANLGDEKGLDGHLLPGLQPNGVPRALRGTVHPFEYNRFDQIEALVREQSIGVIQMEVSRNTGPQNCFLEKIRNLATEKGIVLIFDECTSGFRQTFGGLHKLFGVEPDMAMFGKALGNGYAITAVIGRREVMEAAQTSFISSTFWTERIGPTAALATLKVMERERSWERITEIGLTVKNQWEKLFDRHGIKISQWGLPALAGFTIQSKRSLTYKTLITQEMLARGYLAGNSLYACLEHTNRLIEEYIDELDKVIKIIAECEQGRDITSLLKGPVCYDTFKRLN